MIPVQKMQDYIAAHIEGPITLRMLAQACGYSPWYASRLFKQATGVSPLEYIRALRLSRAAVRLSSEEARIIDVALDFAFDSHEGFTRAFTQRFGMPPSEGRHKPLPLFMPPRISDFYPKWKKGEKKMSEFNKTNTVFVQVVDRPERRMILKRGIKAKDYYEYCEEVGCDVWPELCGIREAVQEPMGLWLPEGMIPEGTSKYVQGVEVPMDYSGGIPEGYETAVLPPCKMMIFQGPPFKDEDFEEAIGSLWQIMEEYHPEFYGFAWADEDAPRFQLAPVGERGYIEGRPVRVV